MPLARLTNYVDGNTLTGAQLNNEFDNILNNGAALVDAAVPAISSVQGLVGTYGAGSLTFAALGYTLRTTSAVATLRSTTAFTVNTQTAGPIANGRDQAAAFDSTDVHFYAITTGGSSTTPAGIASSQPPPTGPTLPAGYSAWAYLASAKYSTGSSDIPTTHNLRVQGSRVIYLNPTLGGTNNLITSANVVNTETPVSVSSWIPAIATEFSVTISNLRTQTPAAGSANIGSTHWFNVDAGGIPLYQWHTYQEATSALSYSPPINGTLDFYVPTSQTPRFYYTHIIAVGTSANMAADLIRYRVPNGDVG